MTIQRCCSLASQNAAGGGRGSRIIGDGSRSLLRCGVSFIEWIVPASILVLLPKCPMCLAAYLALGAGIGLSVSAASIVRIVLMVLCLLSLLLLGLRTAYRLAHRT